MNPNKTRIKTDETVIIYSILLSLSLLGIILFAPNNNLLGFIIKEGVSVADEFQYVPPEDLSMNNAIQALIGSEKERELLEAFNLTTYEINDSLLMAKRYFIGNDLDGIKAAINKTNNSQFDRYLNSLYSFGKTVPAYDIQPKNYSQVFRITQFIKYTRQYAFKVYDAIILADEKEKAYKKEGIDTTEAVHLISEADVSFNSERYSDAEQLLAEADKKLEDSKKEFYRVEYLVFLSKNFIMRYWLEILVILVIVIVSAPTITKKIRIYRAKRKLQTLQIEMGIVNNLIKNAQEECFKFRKIPESLYEVRVAKYKQRLSEIKHTIPVLIGIIEDTKQKKDNGAGGKK